MRMLLSILLLAIALSCSLQEEKEQLGQQALLFAKTNFYEELTASLGKGPKAMQFTKYLEINTTWKVEKVEIITTDRKRVVAHLKYDSFKREFIDQMVDELKNREGKTWNEVLNDLASKPPYQGYISSREARYDYDIDVYYVEFSGHLEHLKTVVR